MGLRIERHDRAAVIILDWPGQRNALGPDEARQLTAALAEAAADSAVCGVVLTGEGAFCAGGNLKGSVFQPGTSAEERGALVYGPIHGMMRAIVGVPVPTVAAVDGPAVGLGFDIALACDSRFVGPKGWCMQGWGKLGFVPGSGGETLLRLRAPNALWTLLETQPRIDGALAERLGVGESSGEATARDRAIARVNALAPMTRESLEAYVELSRAELRARLDGAMQAAAKMQLRFLARADLASRVDATLKK